MSLIPAWRVVSEAPSILVAAHCRHRGEADGRELPAGDRRWLGGRCAADAGPAVGLDTAGLVKHLGFAERHWFQRVAAGSVSELPWAGLPGEEEGRQPFTTGLPAEVVFGFYRDQCERADAIVAATPLSAPPQGRHPGDPAGEICDLRRIILHMIEETARHAGHLDIARELTDTRTGLGQRY